MTMKKGLRGVAVVVVLAWAAGCGGNSTRTSGGQTTAETQQTETAALTATIDEASAVTSTSTCSAITTPTTEGPYYVTGTAALTGGNLNYDKLPGDPITISGYVYSGASKTQPLAGAVVDVWQADAGGTYWPASNGPASG
jgi:protocatechuate 3,4-dioxygenase beta subunit